MAYLRSGIDGGRQGNSLIRNRVVDIRGDLATGGRLVLSTTEPTVVDGNELGRIDFQAPLDTAGTDAILVAASIYAEADNTFSSSVNATELVFAVGKSGTAAEVVRIDQDGQLGIGVATPASLLHVAGTVQVGVDDTGHDVKFFGATAGSFLLWNQTTDALRLTDSSNLEIGDGQDMTFYHNGSNSYITNKTGSFNLATETSAIAIEIGHTTSETRVNDNLTVTGTTTFTGTTDHNSTSQFDAAITVGVDGTGHDVTFYGDTSGRYFMIDASSDNFNIRDNFKFLVGNGGDLQVYHDGTNSYITNATGALKLGTGTSGIAIQIGNSTSETTIEDNLTVTGTHTQTGATQLNSTVTVGVDDTGYDVKFFGATSGSYMLWDESTDRLLLTDDTQFRCGDGGDLQIYHNGTASYISNLTGALNIADQTSGIAVNIGHTTSETTINDNLTVTGSVSVGILGVNSTNGGKFHSEGTNTSTSDNTGNSGGGLSFKNTSDTDGNFNDIGNFASTGLTTSRIVFMTNDHSGRYGGIHFKVSAANYPITKAILYPDGDWYTNDGSVSSISDVRVKTDIVDLSDGLNIVNQLTPRTYKYNGRGDMTEDGGDGVIRYGFIADEVLEVASHYVGVGKGRIDGEMVDDFKSLSTTRMIPMMVKAIQELSAKVTTLENE